jgi:hypothetical protein
MKLKLREIEIFRCGQLQLVDNHQRTASWGLRPRRLARSARPRALCALPPPGIPHRGMRLRRIHCALLSGAHHQLTGPIIHPNRPSKRTLPIALQ